MKKTGMIIGSIMVLLTLSGCSKTPETALVKQKGKNTADYQEEELRDSGQSLRDFLGAPESCQSQLQDATGSLTVKTDAVVEIPETDKLSTTRVRQHPLNQETMEHLSEALVKDARYYSMEAYIEDGSFEEISLKLTEEDNEKSFYSVALLPDQKLYLYCYRSDTGLPMEMLLKRVWDQKDLDWTFAEYQEGASHFRFPENPMEVSLEEIKENAGISLKEARKTAKKLVKETGLDSMELADWNYGCIMTEGPDYTFLIKDYGYIFHFTRKLHDIPVGYVRSSQTGLDDIGSFSKTWDPELFDVVVTKDGIAQVEINNLYDIGEVQTENVKLLSFQEIIEIYEKMILVKNAEVVGDGRTRNYVIDRITLDYARISDPAKEGEGVLVPVWDFFGRYTQTGIDYEQEGKPSYEFGYYDQYESFLTINAVDGTIVNRTMGY